MKTYRGERTNRGCEVTVDGKPLPRCSDLSGNATSAFDWGFVGNGQLSLAMLSDFLGDGARAKAACGAFDQAVVAELPARAWTLTGEEMERALAALPGADEASTADEDDAAGTALGDMPIETADLAPPADADVPSARNGGTHSDREAKTPAATAQH